MLKIINRQLNANKHLNKIPYMSVIKSRLDTERHDRVIVKKNEENPKKVCFLLRLGLGCISRSYSQRGKCMRRCRNDHPITNSQTR